MRPAHHWSSVGARELARENPARLIAVTAVLSIIRCDIVADRRLQSPGSKEIAAPTRTSSPVVRFEEDETTGIPLVAASNATKPNVSRTVGRHHQHSGGLRCLCDRRL